MLIGPLPGYSTRWVIYNNITQIIHGRTQENDAPRMIYDKARIPGENALWRRW
jgi:hypothetical protein